MALACQKDCYLQELTSKVLSCEPGTLTTCVSGKKEKLNGYEVILDDTVLFPEGGGQPDDRGTVNGVEVLRVTRRGADAVHFLPTPLDVGSEVEVKVDWMRRFDNMQQHSGQHLVTAIADSVYGYPTTSWNLGEKTSFIELDTPNLKADQMANIENIVNTKIRERVPMYPTLYQGIDDPELLKVRTRGLPEDHVGPVRVVTIEGVEANMCCGTHVSNLCHLQAIKLLGVEKGKKGKVNLVFVAGQRVLDYLGRSYNNEKALTGLLKGPPHEHAELVKKIQVSQRETNKTSLTLLRDLAILEAQRYLAQTNKEPLFVLHRKEGNNEFMNIICNEIDDKNVCLFLTTGDEQGAGMFLLVGTEQLLADVGPKLLALLEGKGAGKNGKYQGKANKLAKRFEVVKLIRQHLGLAEQ